MSQHALMMKVLKQFRVLLRSMETHYRRVERRSGLGGAQLWALSEITRHRGLTMSELAKTLGIRLSTASNLVSRLEELGLVERARAASDQRVVRLTPTAAGRRTLRSAPRPTAGLLQEALKKMHDRELVSLHGELDKVLRRMGLEGREPGDKLLGEILGERAARAPIKRGR